MKKRNKPLSFVRGLDAARIPWGAGVKKEVKKPSWWTAELETEILSTEKDGVVIINQPGTTEEISVITQSMRQFFYKSHKKKLVFRRLADGDVLVWVWSQRDAEAKYYPFGRS